MIPDHSNIIDRLAAQLESQNHSAETARDMALNILVDRGHANRDGTLTEEGEKRSELGAEGRAIDRAQKRSGYGKQYVYDPETNSTRVVK